MESKKNNPYVWYFKRADKQTYTPNIMVYGQRILIFLV